MATKAIATRRGRTVYVSRGRARSRRAAMTIPVALAAGFVPMIADIVSAYKIGGTEAAAGHVSLCTTGYDPADGKWKPMFAFQHLYGPLLAGVLVHKLAGRLGINRALSRAGIPLLRV